MQNNPAATAMAGTSPTGRLAQFFPDATPVRIPVRITRTDLPVGEASEQGPSEQTVIEFGTPREVIFASNLLLEFAAQLRVVNSDGSLDAEASVVAMQLDDGSTAIAARFDREVANWIVKPVS